MVPAGLRRVGRGGARLRSHLDAAADAAARSRRRRGQHRAGRVHGRPGDRRRRVAAGSAHRLAADGALRVYAALEIAIAVLALVLPFELARARLRCSARPTPTATAARLSRCSGWRRAWCCSSRAGRGDGRDVPAASRGGSCPTPARRPAMPARSTRPTPSARRSARCSPVSCCFPPLGLRATTWVGVALNLAVAAGGAGRSLDRTATAPRGDRAAADATAPTRGQAAARPRASGARGRTGAPVDRRAAPSASRASRR